MTSEKAIDILTPDKVKYTPKEYAEALEIARNSIQSNSLNELFNKQIEFQKLLGNEDIPKDDPIMFSHHLLSLVVEAGEVANSDKRWKQNGRNREYSKDEKLEEISDVFIFLMNLLIYSDITINEFLKVVEFKINKNTNRYGEIA